MVAAVQTFAAAAAVDAFWLPFAEQSLELSAHAVRVVVGVVGVVGVLLAPLALLVAVSLPLL